MSARADAHVHLFEGGYRGGSFASRPGVSIDEAPCYQSLATAHGVSAALVVGYAGESWCTGNNAYLAAIRPSYAWVRPVAYTTPGELSPDRLEGWWEHGFVGISLYLFDPAPEAALAGVDDGVWRWLVEHRWLVSANARGATWTAWQPVLERHPELRLLVSHLGLPPRAARPPSADEARRAMAPVLALARFPGARVKLSGYYAITEPGHGYPHEAAWPHTESLVAAFGASRLLWASDFSPCLDWVTFPQTFGLLAQMPFLGEHERHAIAGANLLALLDDAC